MFGERASEMQDLQAWVLALNLLQVFSDLVQDIC